MPLPKFHNNPLHSCHCFAIVVYNQDFDTIANLEAGSLQALKKGCQMCQHRSVYNLGLERGVVHQLKHHWKQRNGGSYRVSSNQRCSTKPYGICSLCTGEIHNVCSYTFQNAWDHSHNSLYQGFHTLLHIWIFLFHESLHWCKQFGITKWGRPPTIDLA